MFEPIYHYGAESSYYSAKTRAYMRQKGLNFVERFVSHPHYFEHVLPRAGILRMPTIEMPDGEVVQDSSEIIDFLEARYPTRPCYPAGVRQRLAALILEIYADEGLRAAGMLYRWGHREANDPFVIDEFNTAAARGDERDGTRGQKFAEHMSHYFEHLGVTEETIPAIEASTGELFDRLNVHFRQYPYLFGGRASIADAALMGPLYGHFARDPYPALLMRRRAPRLHRWTERMNSREFPPPEFPEAEDAFLQDDAIPETTTAVLELVAQDFFPEVSALLSRYNDWAAGEATGPGVELPFPPRRPAEFGTNSYRMRGVDVSRSARIETIWKWQRPLGFYQSLSGSDRKAADKLLDTLGAGDLFAQEPLPPLARNDRNRFVFDVVGSSSRLRK